MMVKKRRQDAFFFIFVLMVTMLSACATRPSHSSRAGLLDGEGRSSAFAGGGLSESDYQVQEVSASEFPLQGKWQWPLKNVDVSSSYGHRGRKFHQGIDLRAHMRTPVMAASDGVVVYVGNKIRGYGRMIVLKHVGNFYSVYAHHAKNIAKHGKVVKRGEVIALSGKSGHSTGPHLHFEIRRGTESYNPMYALNDNMNRMHVVNRRIASSENRNRVDRSKN